MPGVEHLPAALAGGVLLGAASADRAPVGRDEIDIHAQRFNRSAVTSPCALVIGWSCATMQVTGSPV